MVKNLTNTDKRSIRIARQAIEKLGLNLEGKVVVTETGSNFYKFTPIIALLAGAKKVIAYVADSNYGKAADISKGTKALEAALSVNNRLIIRENTVNKNDFTEADIITNSGFLRPLDRKKLANVGPNCVIPLMFEAWELRQEDIDIEYCKKRRIKVAGTWENHPLINVFPGIRVLAVKIALDAGYELIGNNIAVWSDDHFGQEAAAGFRAMGAKEVFITTDYVELRERLDRLDFIFVCDYDEDRPYFGTNSVWDIADFSSAAIPVGIVKLYGHFPDDNQAVYPRHHTHARQMSYTLGHLGPKLILELLTAGFRVAQHMLEGTTSRLVQPITF